MKNTKHTKMNDSSSDQEVTSQSKRKILTSIGVTSGVLGAGALSQHWVKPVVNSVVLPAHAETTGVEETTPPPTTTVESGPMILVRTESVDSRVNDGGTIVYNVSLSEIPSATVTVTVTVSAGTPTPASLAFTRADYDTPKPVNVAAPADTPANPDGILTLTASDTVAAESSGYAGVTTSVEFTVFEEDNVGVPQSSIKAEPVSIHYKYAAKVTWEHPDTTAKPTHYLVNSDETDVDEMQVPYNGSVETQSVTFGGLPANAGDAARNHTFLVTAVYASGTPASVEMEGLRPDAGGLGTITIPIV